MVPWWTQYQFQDFSLSYFFPYWVLPHVDMLFLIKRDHTFVFFPSTCFPFHGKEPKRATKSLNIQSIFNGATSDHLCLLVLKMCLVSSPAVRRKVIGPSQRQRGPKLRQVCVSADATPDAAVVHPVLARAHLAGAQLLRLPDVTYGRRATAFQGHVNGAPRLPRVCAAGRRRSGRTLKAR
jgi:hypothetical protein